MDRVGAVGADMSVVFLQMCIVASVLSSTGCPQQLQVVLVEFLNGLVGIQSHHKSCLVWYITVQFASHVQHSASRQHQKVIAYILHSWISVET